MTEGGGLDNWRQQNKPTRASALTAKLTKRSQITEQNRGILPRDSTSGGRDARSRHPDPDGAMVAKRMRSDYRAIRTPPRVTRTRWRRSVADLMSIVRRSRSEPSVEPKRFD